jgi:hypothetical protein
MFNERSYVIICVRQLSMQMHATVLTGRIKTQYNKISETIKIENMKDI